MDGRIYKSMMMNNELLFLVSFFMFFEILKSLLFVSFADQFICMCFVRHGGLFAVLLYLILFFFLLSDLTDWFDLIKRKHLFIKSVYLDIHCWLLDDLYS